GAFGTVFKAHDAELDRVVAVKVARGAWWTSPGEGNRFVCAAPAPAPPHQPCIVPAYARGPATWPFLFRAFVERETLSDAPSKRRFGFHEAADVVVQVAEALDHAHQNGVVHRDLKPSNVMLGRLLGSAEPDRPHAFVMDFGLARRDEGEVSVTLEGQILGTPA